MLAFEEKNRIFLRSMEVMDGENGKMTKSVQLRKRENETAGEPGLQHPQAEDEAQRLSNEAQRLSNEEEDGGGTDEAGLEKGGEEEEEEEETEREGEIKKPIFFLWHFTSAAVCLALSIVCFVAVVTIRADCDCEMCVVQLIGYLSVLLVLPCIRMDEFTKVSHWVFFIPAILVMAGLFVAVNAIICCMDRGDMPDILYLDDMSRSGYNCACRMCSPVVYLLVLAGFILFVMRLDGVLPDSFSYAVVFVFPTSGILLELLVLSCCDCSENDRCTLFLSLLVPPVVYGSFILPFALRKDQFFKTSYHFSLIPWYLLVVTVGVFVIVMAAIMCSDACSEYYTRKDTARNDKIRVMKNRLASTLRSALMGTRDIHNVSVRELMY